MVRTTVWFQAIKIGAISKLDDSDFEQFYDISVKLEQNLLCTRLAFAARRLILTVHIICKKNLESSFAVALYCDELPSYVQNDTKPAQKKKWLVISENAAVRGLSRITLNSHKSEDWLHSPFSTNRADVPGCARLR